ncbi:hypothetical protein PHSY_005396 [Pseudozyma hubeiensis SY62]|uniref:Transcriptional regulator n=1 Tax=Pseudozyma hubeiensis (strain SY62) TaxID=1305764 RepID=R9P8V7_PSEHS|nr:hypothetical protein PHSY_005396 [Pseudozyma hubeiensis SY62]GAC97808.1 hypothetical protein PHSY_005396 [Pseudozyma hubeiensis SY62]
MCIHPPWTPGADEVASPLYDGNFGAHVGFPLQDVSRVGELPYVRYFQSGTPHLFPDGCDSYLSIHRTERHCWRYSVTHIRKRISVPKQWSARPSYSSLLHPHDSLYTTKMYLRPETIVSDFSSVIKFIQAHPLGLLTTCIPLAGQSTLQASHLPFHYLPPSTLPVAASSASASVQSVEGTWSGEEGLGNLQCHLARTNPQAKALLHAGEGEEVLIVFSSPINNAGYISPSWYTTTKPATGKTVPTWNYAEVQVYGTIHQTTPQTLSQIVRTLSDTHEHRIKDITGKHVWKTEDAPEKYIELLERAIVGMEIRVSKVGMKVKMSKEKVEGDRTGVVEGLRGLGGVAEGEVADAVESAGRMK